MKAVIKTFTKNYPRGFEKELAFEKGDTIECLLERLLACDEFRGYDVSLFDGMGCICNGHIVARSAVLADKDRITIKKFMSGG